MKTTFSGADIIDNVKHDSERAARKAAFSPFMEFLARLGFGARGLIYLMMGVIAVQVANGGRNAPADQQGALAAIGAQPGGHIVLMVVLVGLAGYALWGVIRTVFDPLHVGSDAKDLLQRLWFLLSAVTYATLIIPTYGYLSGSAKAAQNGAQTVQTQHSVSTIISQPWGRWAVGIVGVIVIVAGVAQVYQGLSRKFDKQFQKYELNSQQRVWIKRIGRFGTAARGVVFGLTGVFITLSAYQANPGKAQGMDGALMALARQPYGFWLLSVVAVGLIAFGVYSITGAAWFRLRR
jgi:hypothetical protein